MREVNIGSVSEFEDPGRKIFGFEGFEVALFKLDGEFFAPHRRISKLNAAFILEVQIERSV